MKDQVILIDQHDRILGVSDKVEAHLGEGKRHRAISVFLINRQGEILIQQRSQTKIVGAGLWANTCCGNVMPGETRKQCAKRRLYQELGISGVSLNKICRFEYHLRCNPRFSEWEIDDVFVGRYDGPVKPNPQEVTDMKWISPQALKTELKVRATQYAPWVPVIFKQDGVRGYFRG